jgi:hypothetical protein
MLPQPQFGRLALGHGVEETTVKESTEKNPFHSFVLFVRTNGQGSGNRLPVGPVISPAAQFGV